MADLGIYLSSLAGILLALLGLIIPILAFASLMINPKRARNIIGLFQDIVLAPVFFLCGLILLFQGWRQDPLLQTVQILTTLATVYLSLKDLLLRLKR